MANLSIIVAPDLIGGYPLGIRSPFVVIARSEATKQSPAIGKAER